MDGLYLIYDMALVLTVSSSLVLAALLWLKAGQREGIRPLVWFCVGVATWSLGHLLIHVGSLSQARFGQALVNLAPLVAASLTHFILVFTGHESRLAVRVLYGVAACVAALALFFEAGRLDQWLAFQRFYIMDGDGWGVAVVTGLMTFLGHGVLLRTLWSGTNRKIYRQLLSVFIATAGGMVSASGAVFASLGISFFPYPMLLLPGYSIMLVYGILRYEFMDVNVWARQSLTAALLAGGIVLSVSLLIAGAASVGMTPLADLPLWQVWVFALVVLGLAGFLRRPMANIATRLVYLGSRLEAEGMTLWRQELERANNWEELRLSAERLLSEHMHQLIDAHIVPYAPGRVSSKPQVVSRKGVAGWVGELQQWETATPGIRQAGEVFASLFAAAATRLEQALSIAEREKSMLAQSHLAELGRLSATVAHELRNPLNIISMASTNCSPDVSQEILEQVRRAERLTGDLLTYTKTLSLEKHRVNLKDQIDYVQGHYRNAPMTIMAEIREDVTVAVDAHRFHQVLFNLLDNAKAALSDVQQPQVEISTMATPREVVISVCDNGVGVLPAMKPQLFHPFVSGRAGGYGLGLALVRRIMEAHGGSIALVERTGWSTCFELRFPQEDVA
jgi:signal transduction histidine kinase